MAKKQLSHTERVLNIWAIVLIIWSIYRVNFKTDLPIWIDEFVAKPLIFILPVYFFITRIEKKKFFEGVNLLMSNARSGILLGSGIGVLFVIFTLFWSNRVVNTENSIYYFVLSIATSFSEEILAFGFVLKRLLDDSKNYFTAVFFASILFFITHLPKFFSTDTLTGELLLRLLVLDFCLGMILSTIFVFRKNLWLTISIHTFYLFTIYLFI